MERLVQWRRKQEGKLGYILLWALGVVFVCHWCGQVGNKPGHELNSTLDSGLSAFHLRAAEVWPHARRLERTRCLQALGRAPRLRALLL